MKIFNFGRFFRERDTRSFRFRKLITGVLVAIFGLGVGVFLGLIVKNSEVFAQSGQKKVSLEARKTTNDQIRFSDLKIGESTRPFEEGFSESKGWIGRTSFEIENISAQEIIYLKLNVLFPETRATGPLMAFGLSFGNRPGSSIQSNKTLKFAKGEKMTIDLADQYQRITKFVSHGFPIDDINQIDLEASFIVFSDGTAWNVGALMRQDPEDPDRWLPIQMPGHVPTKPQNKENKP